MSENDHDIRIVRAADVPALPWKNGGGTTRELLRLPATGDWNLRISLADISADGPFSSFEGIERWFAVIEGNGVRLDWNGRERLMDTSAWPLCFDGGQAPGCRLIDGPTRDLNVMARQGHASMLLMPAALHTPLRWSGRGRGIFSLRRLVLQPGHGETIHLPKHTLAWQDAGDGAAWTLHAPDDSDAAAAHTDGAPPAYAFVAK